MTKINISIITTLVLLSTNSLASMGIPETSFAKIVTEKTEAPAQVEAVVEKASAQVEAVVEQAPAQVEAVVEQAPAQVEAVVEQAPAQVEAVVEQAPAQVEAVVEQAPAQVEAVVEQAPAQVEAVVEQAPAQVEAVVEQAPAQVEAVVEQAPAQVEAVVEQAPAKVEAVVEQAPAQVEAVVEQAPAQVEAVVEQAPVAAPVKTVVQKVAQPIKPRVSTTIITMPRVPKPPEVTVIAPKLILLDSDGNLIPKDKMEIAPVKDPHIFSNRVAPARFNENVEHRKVEILPGDIVNSRVAAYLHGSLISVDDATSRLEKAGFTILTKFKVDKKGKVTSIVFTNDEMKKAASKTMRGFAGSLRVLVDTINKQTVISNPIYLMKAFMQKDYDQELAVSTLTSLRSVFTDAKNSQEVIKFSTLERFQFMENMPYYQDMKQISEGKNKDLLAKAKKSKKVVYEQHLENGSIIVGVKLGKRTSKFVKKIGYQNSGLLPYPVLIEDGKAKILAPQYYIAVMYPMLKMSQFMTIATVPGAINKDVFKVFR